MCALSRLPHMADDAGVFFVRTPRHVDACDVHLVRDKRLDGRPVFGGRSECRDDLCAGDRVHRDVWGVSRSARSETLASVTSVMMRSPIFSNTVCESYRTAYSWIGTCASRSFRFEPRSTMAPAPSPLSLPSEAKEANTCPPVNISRETSAMYPFRPPDPFPPGGTARRGSPPKIIM